MSNLPPATVRDARRERLAMLRKLATVVVVLGICFVSCRMWKQFWRSTSSKELEARQDKARARVGHGLDELFERMLDDESSILDLAATFDIARDLGTGYDPSDCALGLSAAFEEALGPDVIGFSALGIGPESRAKLVMTAKITPSGSRFQLPHSQASFPGIAMTADLKLLGRSLHVETSPTGTLEFKRFRLASMPFEEMTASDVAGGIMQGTCQDLGHALLEQLTTWKRPKPKQADPLEACTQGFHCRENAEALEATDPAVAATLYDEACQHDDETSCARLAALALASAKPNNLSQANVSVEMACSRELPIACEALGKLESARSASVRALLGYLRACDLGLASACTAAVPLLADTPFAAAASVLTTGHPVTTKLGTVFALHWGQWTKWDRGQPTAWVSKLPAQLPAGAFATTFEPGKIPAGITPPPGTDTVYAVAFEGGSKPDDRCLGCRPSGGYGDRYRMPAFDCVCVLAPKKN